MSVPNIQQHSILVTTQARVSTYAATDIEKLNDDQVRSLKNLPTLEAIQKEVAEVKKAIEVGYSCSEMVFSYLNDTFPDTRT
jgi:hypothetical protein